MCTEWIASHVGAACRRDGSVTVRHIAAIGRSHGRIGPRRGSCRGFTLIELIVGIVVLSVGLAGILLVFNQTVVRSADPMLQQQAVALAEGYMDEILGKDYRDCSVSSSPTGSRAERDDVEDYDGVNDSPPQDIRGNVLAGLEGYRVQVSTESATLNGVTGCRITVTATHDGDAGVRAELVGWRLED